MSQLPSVQLQGPGVFAQPTTPFAYQESQTILPKPQVAIGFRGLDLGAIAQSAAKLGVEVVNTYNEQQVAKTESALQALNNKTASLIDQWSSVNDFDGVQLTYDEYKEARKDILGFDPDDEETGSMLGPYGKLAANARSFSAGIDADIEKKKRGWSDTIAYDNYESYMDRESKYFEQADDKVSANTKRLSDLEQVFKHQAGVDITSELPKQGFTVDQRKLFLKMKKDYTDLMEVQTKLTTGKPQIHDIGERARSVFVLSETLFDAAKRNSDQIAKIEEKGKLTPEEQVLVQQLKAEATRLSIDALNQRRFGMSMITDQMKRQYIQENYPDLGPDENPEDFPDLYPIPDVFRDSGSLDSFGMAMTSGISAEAGNAMKRAWDAETNTMNSNIAGILNTTRAINNERVKDATNKIDIEVVTLEDELKKLDVQISREDDEANQNFLMLRKVALLDALEKKIRDKYIIPSLPRDIQARSPALVGFLSDQAQSKRRRSTQIDADNMKAALRLSMSDSMGFGLGFDADSRNILDAAIGQKANNVMPIYDHAIKTVTRLRTEYADSPSGKSGLSARQTAQKLRDQYIRLQQGGVQYEKLSGSDMRSLAMMGAAGRISSTGGLDPSTGSLPTLDEALDTVRKNKGNDAFGGNKLPFDTRMFAMTPWYREMMLKADSMDQEKAMQYIQDTINDFITGPEGMAGKFEDYVPQTGRPDDIPADSETANMVMEYILDPTKNDSTTAVSLMILPKETRESVLARARERARTTRDSATRTQMDIRLDWFDRLNSSYSGQQSSLNHVKAFKASGIDPLLVRVSNDAARSVDTFKTPEAMDKLSDKANNSNNPKFVEDTKFAMKYFKKILPELSRKVAIPGWTPDYAENLSARELLHDNFSDTIMLYLHKAARKDSGVPGEPSLDFDFDKPGLIDDVSRMLNEHLNNNNYRYSTIDGGFVRTYAERKTTPNGAKKTVISDKDIMAGSTLSVPEKYRNRFVGLSGQFKHSPDADEISQKMYLAQVGDARSITKADYDYMKDDPYHGLIEYGVVKNNYVPRTTLQQFGVQESEALSQLTRSAAAGMPHDNLSALASMAAMSMLDPASTDIEAAKSFVSTTAARIRRDVLAGNESNFTLDVVEYPAQDGKGSYLPTMVIKSGDRILSSFQLNSESYRSDDPLGISTQLAHLSDDYLGSMLTTTGQQDGNFERQAIAYLIKHPEKTLDASIEETWGYGMSRRHVYFTRKNEDGSTDIILGKKYSTLSGRTVNPQDEANIERSEKIIANIPAEKTKKYEKYDVPSVKPMQDWLDKIIDEAYVLNPYVRETQFNEYQEEIPVTQSDVDAYNRVEANRYDRAVASAEVQARIEDIGRQIDAQIGGLLSRFSTEAAVKAYKDRLDRKKQDQLNENQKNDMMRYDDTVQDFKKNNPQLLQYRSSVLQAMEKAYRPQTEQ